MMCASITVRIVESNTGKDRTGFEPIEWDGIEGEGGSCSCPMFGPAEGYPAHDLALRDRLRADFYDKALWPAMNAAGWADVVIEIR